MPDRDLSELGVGRGGLIDRAIARSGQEFGARTGGVVARGADPDTGAMLDEAFNAFKTAPTPVERQRALLRLRDMVEQERLAQIDRGEIPPDPAQVPQLARIPAGHEVDPSQIPPGQGVIRELPPEPPAQSPLSFAGRVGPTSLERPLLSRALERPWAAPPQYDVEFEPSTIR